MASSDDVAGNLHYAEEQGLDSIDRYWDLRRPSETWDEAGPSATSLPGGRFCSRRLRTIRILLHNHCERDRGSAVSGGRESISDTCFQFHRCRTLTRRSTRRAPNGCPLRE